MLSFRLTAKALNDLKSIGRFTQKMWGREQRNIYLSKLDESFHLLADQPFLGTARDDIRENYRVYHVGRHLIFYRQHPAYIEIIRILHDRMDVETRFGK
ncbi:MAG: type II toxin-antitoxin system RelE/ParE family toxin [Deltaproteobacteria bacterium]|nr:type II toxin-antitoxin system RelE/ParE family toxin [Deltaproteobacteria bacterium]MBW1959296.1 type II toxin-antitoxin system RelE/ParE family toxin [Deltaproteobacteria bacterium]MBW2014287.1 type II toxin-antitoxin system RelE/ParE family toxin [Deltaproteobacteria bacterium]MBW2087645.1 type II toxin-antitoxin system RelE/ParE family toxin [Deltaproteobacteria bacterium]MBW2319830.1 type II toxin-antitoxin system RelE/ParE family toxin [Deltaproteobacteria bacterium]